MFTGLQKRAPAKNVLLAEGQEESKGQLTEAATIQGGAITSQLGAHTIHAKKGNSSS